MDIILAWLHGVLASPEFAALALGAFTTAVGTVVGWLGLQFRRHILRRLSAQELALLQQIASIAVAYVEQTAIGRESEAKLQEAIRIANTYLAAYGIQVRAEQLVAIIEAAVYAEATKTELPEPAL